MSSNKVVKDKGQLRDPNPKLNHHRNDLKASMSTLKGILFSCTTVLSWLPVKLQ